MEYLIISAATEGSRYVECMDRQREIHGERFVGFVMPDRGSWAENTKLKPDAFRLGFALHPVCLWIDADCSVNPPELLLEGNWDIAFTQNIHPKHRNRTSAGFILARNTRGTDRFLRRWDVENTRHKKDHPALTRIIVNGGHGARIGDMTAWLAGRHTINDLMPDRGAYRSCV